LAGQKKRNSLLIRSLVDAKLSYREIARIAKCSHGSVHAELVAYRREKEEALKTQAQTLQSDKPLIFDEVRATMEQMNIPEGTIQDVNKKIEDDARSNVQEIQGVYYETVD
jgi:predicted acylesterase/phospholipase RssA